MLASLTLRERYKELMVQGRGGEGIRRRRDYYYLRRFGQCSIFEPCRQFKVRRPSFGIRRISPLPCGIIGRFYSSDVRSYSRAAVVVLREKLEERRIHGIVRTIELPGQPTQ